MEQLELAPGLTAGRLGFGCCPLGGHGWGTVNQEEILRAANVALDLGINLFDTADIYGLGQSEIALADVARTRRDEMVLATKFGVRREDGETWHDNSPAWIRQACEDSLVRLGVEAIDVYQIHYWDEKTPWDDILAALEELRNSGKIRYAGVSNVPAKLLERDRLPDWIVAFQMQFSLLEQGDRRVIDQIKEKWGLAFWSWGSLAQGMLSGKYGSGVEFDARDRRSRPVYQSFHGEGAATSERIVEVLRRVASELGRTPAQVALRFVLDEFTNGLPLVGIKSVAQLLENSGALGWKLDDTHRKELNPLVVQASCLLRSTTLNPLPRPEDTVVPQD